MAKLHAILAVAIVATPLLLLSQAEDPHEGQPASCDNFRGTVPSHRCTCNRATECPTGEHREEDRKCKTYCRPEACKCLHPCTS